MANEITIGDLPVAEANPKVAVVRPDTTDARFIQQSGEIAGGLVEGAQQAVVGSQLRKVGEGLSATQELADRRFKASQEGSVLDEETAISQIEKDLDSRARREFQTIRASLSQAGLNRPRAAMAARTRAEQVVRNASLTTPGFSSSIRKSAADVLGFDPTGATMQALFGMQDPKVDDVPTPAEVSKSLLGNLYDTDFGRYFETLRVNNNMTPQETMAYVIDNGQMGQANKMYASRVKVENGQQSLNAYTSDWISTVVADSDPVKDLIQGIQAGIVDKNGFRAADQVTMSAQIDILIEEQVSSYIEGVKAIPGAVVDTAQVEAVRNSLINKYASTKKALGEANTLKFTQENVDLIEAQADEGIWKTMPELALLSRLGNGIGQTALDLQMKNYNSKESLKIMAKNYPGTLGKIIDGTSTNEVLKAITATQAQILGGAENEDPLDDPAAQKDLEKQVAIDAVQGGGLRNPEIVDNLLAQKPNIVLANIAQNPKLADQVPKEKIKDIQLEFGSQSYRLMQNLAKRIAEPGVRASVGNIREFIPAENRKAGDSAYRTTQGLILTDSSGKNIEWGNSPEFNVMNNNLIPLTANERLMAGTNISEENSTEFFTSQINLAITEQQMINLEKDMREVAQTINTTSDPTIKEAEKIRFNQMKEAHQDLTTSYDLEADNLRRFGMEVPK